MPFDETPVSVMTAVSYSIRPENKTVRTSSYHQKQHQTRLQMMQTHHNSCHALIPRAISVPLLIRQICCGVEAGRRSDDESEHSFFFLESDLKQETL